MNTSRSNIVLTALALLVGLLAAFLSPGTTLAETTGFPHEVEFDAIVPQEISQNSPFTVTVVAKNTTNSQKQFDMEIFVGGPAWSGENLPYTFSSDTEIYWVECGTENAQGGCRYWWRGEISAQERVEFKLPTSSGEITGNSLKIAEVQTLEPYRLTILKFMNVTSPGEVVLNGGTYTVTAGAISEIFLWKNDIVNPEGNWSTGANFDDLPFEVDHFSPGFLRLHNPPAGVYSIPYWLHWDGGTENATAVINVEEPVADDPPTEDHRTFLPHVVR